MSVSPSEFTSACLWLFVAFLILGWPEDVSSNSQLEDVNVLSHGSPLLTVIAKQLPTATSAQDRLRRAVPNPESFDCSAPSQPTQGEWKLHRDSCEGNIDCTISEGTILRPGSHLIYSCNAGYRLEGSPDVFCGVSGSWLTIPVCKEIRCKSLSSVSTLVTCYLRGEWTNCDVSVPPGTQAEVSCRSGYKQERVVMTTEQNHVTCNDMGEWEPNPIKCVSVCGRTSTQLSPVMMGAVPAEITDFPWHASLHVKQISSTGNQTSMKYICGATIIKTNFLVTAAHCVYLEDSRTTIDPEKLFVITGNIFSAYDFPLHDPRIVRKNTVKKIYRHCNYCGLIGNYGSDIALLELQKPFEFSEILQPVCIDDSGDGERILQSGVPGKVPGFGKTNESEVSVILQTLSMPYIPHNQCVASKNADKSEGLISSDKFCAGHSNGSAVCEGDSGGGVVFERGSVWYLMGIVSTGLGVDFTKGERTCEKFAYSLHIRVSTYTPWIKKVLYHAEKNKPYPSCTLATCLAPEQPANGEWRAHLDPCNGDDCKKFARPMFDENHQLNYSCNPGFELNGNPFVFCSYRRKWTPVPSCVPRPDTPCIDEKKNTVIRFGNELDTPFHNISHQLYPIITAPPPTEVEHRWAYEITEPTWKNSPCNFLDGSLGVCTLLKNCPSVLNELLSLLKPPEKLCEFTGKNPIICCPISVVPVTTAPSLVSGIIIPPSDKRGEIASKKCTEYSEYVYSWKCPPLDPDPRYPVNVSESTGKSRVERLEFPHMVAIGFEPKPDDIKWKGGGTLISGNFVLTTAHGIYQKNWGNAAWVRLGDLNLVRSDDGATPVDRRIIQRIRHPDYNPRSYYHDIALLRLASSVPFNGWVRPACLYTKPTVWAQEAVATGWGHVDRNDTVPSANLMKVTLPLVDTETCAENWNSSSMDTKLPNGIVEDYVICAGAKDRDTCQGDSGGPLFIPSKKENHCMYDVIGVMAFGKLPCGSGIPGLYTRVYNYLPWIESTVWGHEEVPISNAT